VRVDTDDVPAHSARSIGALFYPIGTAIAFARLITPRHAGGRKLLAQQLMHVAQQAPAAMPLSLGQPQNGKPPRRRTTSRLVRR
jgi:uncharacterized protein DUF4157